MKRQPRAPEIHDVRTWTARCSYCGCRTTYHGQYEGEYHDCESCTEMQSPHCQSCGDALNLDEIAADAILCRVCLDEHDEPDTRFGNWEDIEDNDARP